jgi:hypothetical protein
VPPKKKKKKRKLCFTLAKKVFYLGQEDLMHRNWKRKGYSSVQSTCLVACMRLWIPTPAWGEKKVVVPDMDSGAFYQRRVYHK